jgi:phosphohistidine phosphatase
VTSRAIVILRHGKSNWAAGHGRDLIRPLAPRGSSSAAAVGRFLASVGQVPDLVLCSPATRARQTANLAMEAGEWPCPLEIREELYHGATARILTMLEGQSDSAKVIMLVGHEPSSSNLIADLIGGGRHRVPTSALARVGLDLPGWGQITSGIGQLEWLVPSRVLLAAEASHSREAQPE